jgi:hypothetical protein
MEELAREERRGAEAERDARLGIWSFQERRYPEFDFIRTGELSIQIKDEYVRGLRRIGATASVKNSKGSLRISRVGLLPIWPALRQGARSTNAGSAIGSDSDNLQH